MDETVKIEETITETITVTEDKEAPPAGTLNTGNGPATEGETTATDVAPVAAGETDAPQSAGDTAPAEGEPQPAAAETADTAPKADDSSSAPSVTSPIEADGVKEAESGLPNVDVTIDGETVPGVLVDGPTQGETSATSASDTQSQEAGQQTSVDGAEPTSPEGNADATPEEQQASDATAGDSEAATTEEETAPEN